MGPVLIVAGDLGDKEYAKALCIQADIFIGLYQYV